ncbi:UvrB/UvrC motif-containing protein [Cupriavidus pauculus]|uniref:UvrB/UvrC motif-containing protein n=1 Tax=Cupriavidus pauculus TaxID=82633 RepID=UPI001D0CB668|nr:UvrB/UvrC motif-containing protein [Cupriavidus pauculus]
MAQTNGRVDRTGVVNFSDARLSVWEDPRSQVQVMGDWETIFKKQVFIRIAQKLRQIGWTVEMNPIDPLDVERYGGKVSRWAQERRRICRKGDLHGELEISGRCIQLEFWQDAQNVSNPNGGRYDSDKEDRMTYLQRLELNRTRNRIRDYLCAVFTGYTHKPTERKLGFAGLTALEYVDKRIKGSGHYRPELGHAQIYGKPKTADGTELHHGSYVYGFDRKGRPFCGTAFYDLNSRWVVVTGRYDVQYVDGSELYTSVPQNLKVKRNDSLRRKHLERALQVAVEKMDFERAAKVRDVLFPGNPSLFVVWHREHELYHRPGFCGYTRDRSKAGRFTAAEVRGWGLAPNEIRPAVDESCAA